MPVLEKPSLAQYQAAKAILANPGSTEAQQQDARAIVSAYDAAPASAGGYPKDITVRGEKWTVYNAQQEADVKAGDGAQSQELPSAPRIRAKFVVTGITKQANGVSVATMAAAFDNLVGHTGGIGAPVVQRPPANAAPKGSVSMELSAADAGSIAMGQAFYLISA